MDSRHLARLPKDLIEKCADWAERAVADGRMRNSLTVLDADKNVDLLFHAKMAECVIALYYGLDPERVINWEDGCDTGHDVSLGINKRADVKHTTYRNGALLWSFGKNHVFAEKKFDVLILVRGDWLTGFEIAGWTSKEHFALNHRVADAGHRLKLGTRFMEAADLWDIGTLTLDEAA